MEEKKAALKAEFEALDKACKALTAVLVAINGAREKAEEELSALVDRRSEIVDELLKLQ